MITITMAAILALEFFYIGFVLLNYYFSWMNTENFQFHAWVFEHGKNLVPQDIYKIMNVAIMEGDPNRITRPIADILRFTDAKFRAFSWNFIPPHPSFSYLWPLHLGGIPVLLYKFFRNMGCVRPIAIAGTGLYISSIGFLVPVVMFFHPGKGMVNFLTVSALFLGSVLYKKAAGRTGRVAVQEMPYFLLQFIALLGVCFLSFFCDETGVFIPVILGIIFFPLLLRLKEWPLLPLSFACLYASYGLIIFFILPFVHYKVLGSHIDIRGSMYTPILSDFSLTNLFINMRWLFMDYPHVQLNAAQLFSNNKPMFVLQVIYSAAMLCFAIAVIRLRGRWLNVGERSGQIKRSFLLLFVFVFLDTLVLSKFVLTWGCWYYGALFPLLYFIFFVFLMQGVWENEQGHFFKRLFIPFVTCAIMQSLICSTYRIDIFDFKKSVNAGYDRKDIFNGNIGKYYREFNIVEGIKNSDCRRLYIMLTWAQAKHKHVKSISKEKIDYCREILGRDVSFPMESQYVGIEL